MPAARRSPRAGARGRRRRAAASVRVCSWLSGTSDSPSARLEMAETAATRSPAWRARIVSWTVDMPTASAPMRAEGADLGRGLEARPADREVDALGEVDAQLRRRWRAARRAARGRRRRPGSGSAGRWRRRWGRSSGLCPVRLMWSEIAISRPGPTSGRSEPAALVSTRTSAPAAASARTGRDARPGVAALVEVRAAHEHAHRHAAAAGRGPRGRRGRGRSGAGSRAARRSRC